MNTKTLVGNKGEWSELYTFLKLLADGKLYAADKNLEKMPHIFYPIVSIIRQEIEKNLKYNVLEGSISIFDNITDTVISTIPTIEFINYSKFLMGKLKESKGRSVSFPELESFLSIINVERLSDSKGQKSDIQLIAHDPKTAMISQFGFSIKSLIGKDSTLFNAGTGTNFIYKVIFPDDVLIDIAKFNKDSLVSGKITTRIAKIESLGGQFKFHSVQSKRLQLNLTLIDTALPQILSDMVYYRYRDNVLKINTLCALLNERNPMNFDMHCGHPFYEHKIKNLLTDTALGMTPEKVWHGQYDATGGLIFVKENGDVLCYHIYNRNEFQEYLFNHTRLEQASTSEDEDNPGNARTEKKAKPFKFGWLYEEDGKLFFKLNLQIRFSD